MRLLPDTVIARQDDHRPRYYGKKPTFEIVARRVLVEMVHYLGTNGLSMLECLARVQQSPDYEFAWVNVYVAGEEPHESVLVIQCLGNQKQ